MEFLRPALLGDGDFERLGKFIMSQYGIKMPPFKKTFLQSRLQKRLRVLGFDDFKEYADFVFSPRGKTEELQHMIDAVSTNKTDFFREPIHFDFLFSQGLDEYLAETGKRSLSVWSAGCSSGEEPYSIAMQLKEYSEMHHHIDFRIIATDISNGVLQHAAIGIYNDDKINMIPSNFQSKYLQRGKGAYEHKVRIASELRNKIIFKPFNLLDREYIGMGQFDIIFCRNVMIYFEKEVQYRILKQLSQHIYTHGYLFLGHSESITGLDLPLLHIKPTIFMKNGNKV
jgi:chemotaxis protein methyltransferase CheR